MVHVNVGGLPLNGYLDQILCPLSEWTAAMTVDPATLTGWSSEPAGRASIRWATQWAKSKACLLLMVPSVIMPEDRNILINPQHPVIAAVKIAKVRKWTQD